MRARGGRRRALTIDGFLRPRRAPTLRSNTNHTGKGTHPWNDRLQPYGMAR